MSICGVVLAAGASTRFGSAKQLCMKDGSTMLNHIVTSLKQTSVSDVLVVLGANFEQIQPSLIDTDWVKNENWSCGMGSSIALGVETALLRNAKITHVLLVLADQADVTQQAITRLLTAADKHHTNIVASEYNHTLGVPAVFPRRMFNQMMNMKSEQGAKNLIVNEASRVNLVDMPEASLDIDTPGDYQLWLNRANNPQQ